MSYLGSKCITPPPFPNPGGTDIISCFAGQNPTVPVYRGELQSRNLGMAVECWDTDGGWWNHALNIIMLGYGSLKFL